VLVREYLLYLLVRAPLPSDLWANWRCPEKLTTEQMFGTIVSGSR
jgi:hypothetical protein